jgi:hypothetical protein
MDGETSPIGGGAFYFAWGCFRDFVFGANPTGPVGAGPAAKPHDEKVTLHHTVRSWTVHAA